MAGSDMPDGRLPRVLLLGMPDVASAFDRVMRIPNLAIVSLAGNLDGAEVRVLDLVLESGAVGKAVRGTLREFRPDLVGLSAMTFQYKTACAVAKITREELSEARIVLGGYHATLAYEQIATEPDAEAIDFIVRGEGEATLNALLASVVPFREQDSRNTARGRSALASIPGLSYRTPGGFVHNPSSGLADLSVVRLPNRSARIRGRFHYFGKPFDVVETSRGCPKGCRFCCIRSMYGQSYREFTLERVIEDIRQARERGARGVFFADDNINLRPGRLAELCEAIVDSGLSDMEFISQADVAGFERSPGLPQVMRNAGFSGVFLGIESVNSGNWRFLRKSNSWESAAKVVAGLRSRGIMVAGGFIVGSPDDDRASIAGAFRAARSLPLDHAIMWCLTPYPGTEAREDLISEGLVVNPDRFERYNGFICNVRTRRLEHSELVRAIAAEGLKTYLHPAFLTRGRVWRSSPRKLWAYYACIQEYLTRAYGNRLFESRHRM